MAPCGVSPHFREGHPRYFFKLTLIEDKSIEKPTFALHGHGSSPDDPTICLFLSECISFFFRTYLFLFRTYRFRFFPTLKTYLLTERLSRFRTSLFRLFLSARLSSQNVLLYLRGISTGCRPPQAHPTPLGHGYHDDPCALKKGGRRSSRKIATEEI